MLVVATGGCCIVVNLDSRAENFIEVRRCLKSVAKCCHGFGSTANSFACEADDYLVDEGMWSLSCLSQVLVADEMDRVE